MTSRAVYLFVLSLAGLLAGVLRGQATLALISFAAFTWALFEWLRLQARVHFELPRFQFQRFVGGRNETAGTLWAGRSVSVALHLRGNVHMHLRNVVLQDVVPEIFEFEHAAKPLDVPEFAAHNTWRSLPGRFFSRLWLVSSMRPNSLLPDYVPPADNWWSEEQGRNTFEYTARSRAAGLAVFPGIRVTLVDAFGLFQCSHFLPLEQTFRILPDYFQSADMRPSVKRYNSLPSHGIHRMQRSGLSSELLELREYAPGDPPKSIAWKASARREMLMVRQYESEVPVRVQFFIDGSLATRMGGFGARLLDQINYVAASLAKAAISVGDPVNMTLIDERHSQRLPWFSGDLGFLQLLRSLAEFSNVLPSDQPRMSASLVQFAVALCQQRYPELLDRSYNTTPFSFFAATREKYRLIGVLGELFELTPTEQAECYVDDTRLARYAQRLLFVSGMPWMFPLFNEEKPMDSSLFVPLLAKAISRATLRARDNEVFAVLADAYSCAQHLDVLLPAVKLALAKHNRVIFVCPTPTFRRPQALALEPQNDSIQELLLVSEQARARELKAFLKRELAHLGVAVTYSGERNAIRLVISEIDMARDGRTTMRGGRS